MDSPCAALIDSGTSQILIPISSVLELSRVAEKCAKEGSALASKDALSAYLPSDIERILYSGTYLRAARCKKSIHNVFIFGQELKSH